MKNVFVLLVLVNIVYFMWTNMGPHFPLTQSDALVLAKSEMTGERIILIDELSELSGAEVNLENEDKNKQLNRFEVMQSTGSNLSDLWRTIVSKSINNALKSAASVNLEKRTNNLLDPFESSLSLEGFGPTLAIDNSVDLAPYNNKGPICYKIGPRQSKRPLRALAKALYRRGYESDIASELLDLKTGYMVYFPAADNYSDSRKNIKLLRSKGVRDLWLFEKGEQRGVISLGRFKVRDRAITMKKQLQEKGVNAHVKATYAKKNGYFLFFRWLGSTAEFKTVLKNSKTGIDGLERLPLNKCS